MPQERSAAEIYGRDFPVGAVVFEEGDPGSRMYAIISERTVPEVGEYAEQELLVRYEAPAAEVSGLPGGDERASAELRDLADYLGLARRFDPEERARSTP